MRVTSIDVWRNGNCMPSIKGDPMNLIFQNLVSIAILDGSPARYLGSGSFMNEERCVYRSGLMLTKSDTFDFSEILNYFKIDVLTY